jgi:membrane-associated phospholipid phosphatase
VRNIFLITTALSVIIYNVFPVAPPRLATGLRYHGHPFHFIDTVFVGKGVDLSFDRYAAMPSLHVAWATIVGLGVAWLARPILLRLLGLVYPFMMGVAVIVTGNHYIADCLGGAAVVVIAWFISILISRLQSRQQGLSRRAWRIEPAKATVGTKRISSVEGQSYRKPQGNAR